MNSTQNSAEDKQQRVFSNHNRNNRADIFRRTQEIAPNDMTHILNSSQYLIKES